MKTKKEREKKRKGEKERNKKEIVPVCLCCVRTPHGSMLESSEVSTLNDGLNLRPFFKSRLKPSR